MSKIKSNNPITREKYIDRVEKMYQKEKINKDVNALQEVYKD